MIYGEQMPNILTAISPSSTRLRRVTGSEDTRPAHPRWEGHQPFRFRRLKSALCLTVRRATGAWLQRDEMGSRPRSSSPIFRTALSALHTDQPKEFPSPGARMSCDSLLCTLLSRTRTATLPISTFDWRSSSGSRNPCTSLCRSMRSSHNTLCHHLQKPATQSASPPTLLFR
jgi:hypothetical protein